MLLKQCERPGCTRQTVIEPGNHSYTPAKWVRLTRSRASTSTGRTEFQEYEVCSPECEKLVLSDWLNNPMADRCL